MVVMRCSRRRRRGMAQFDRLTMWRVEIVRHVAWRSLISAVDAAPFRPTMVSSASEVTPPTPGGQSWRCFATLSLAAIVDGGRW